MNRLLSTFVVGLAGIQGITLAAASRPKLVVGIMVDQLRTDYLEDLYNLFGEGGFKRLMDNGLYLKDVDFEIPGSDAAAATAIIQTGTYPRYSGITGSYVFDPATKTYQSIFNDAAFIGNFTNETYSPSALRVTTITDELSVDELGKTRVHSIAPDAAQAIVMAGHTGNSAFWLNDETGRWSSTTFYNNVPDILAKGNYSNPLISRLDTMSWTPLFTGPAYPYVPYKEINQGFKYKFSKSDKNVFKLYKQTPYLNSEITKAATDYITQLKLGSNNEGTDVLNLGYTLAPYPEAVDGGYRFELQDAYLRLDKNLEELFKNLDRYVGKEDVLVYLVSTGYFTEPVPDKDLYRLPTGTFSVKRALSLLNSFLSAKYGNGAYVDYYSNGHVYLSEKTLEEKQLDPIRISEEARDFIVRMSGVEDAYTIADLMSPAIPQLEGYRLSTDPKSAGDVVLEFNAGWKVVDDSRYPSEEELNKTTAYPSPGFIMGPGIGAKVVESPVKATSLAPTIAGKMRIRPPNSATGKQIPLL